MANPSTPAVTDTNEFLHRVLTDGRYIESFHQHPRMVALSLGVELAPETALRLSTTDRGVLLDELYNAKFGPGVNPIHPYILQEADTADVGAAVAVGIVAGIVTAGVCALIVWGKSDLSPASPLPEPKPEGVWSRGVLDYSQAAASKL